MSFSTTYTRTKSFTNGGSLLPADLNNIQDDLGNQLALANIAAGVNEGSNVRRGKSIISTTESRTNTAYGLLTTPDRVQNIVLPTDGLIFILFHATWQQAVASAARAAIFIGANQLVTVSGGPTGSTSTVAQEVNLGTSVAIDTPLATHGGGLYAPSGPTVSVPSPATTGQVVGARDTAFTSVPTTDIGGVCAVFAAAGTYTVSIQFKASSGSVTAKNRKLWVWSSSFG